MIKNNPYKILFNDGPDLKQFLKKIPPVKAEKLVQPVVPTLNFWVYDKYGRRSCPLLFLGWRALFRDEMAIAGDVYINCYGFGQEIHVNATPKTGILVKEEEVGWNANNIPEGWYFYRKIGPRILEKNKIFSEPLPLP
jgi:hypothetical protein